MYIVTGAAGFIGSNVVKELNRRGHRDVLAVDTLEQGDRFRNLADCDIADFMDIGEFRDLVRSGRDIGRVAAVLHQGACADTTESDGRYMMDNNYTYSKELLRWSLDRRAPFVYASSASVYGDNKVCREEPSYENPLNVYAYSKCLFDRHVSRMMRVIDSTVVGLRYFNVYGPREVYKGRMASVVHQLWKQLEASGVARLFEGTDGYGNGEQRRDFVFVGDVVDVNLHFAAGAAHRGIYNVGTGRSRSFNDVANALISHLGGGRIEYIPFPSSLAGKYQSFTEADVANLRGAGYDAPFTPLERGVALLCDQRTD